MLIGNNQKVSVSAGETHFRSFTLIAVSRGSQHQGQLRVALLYLGNRARDTGRRVGIVNIDVWRSI
jgi:hypothetical protein